MSLTFEQMAQSHKRWDEMDERLKKLIGFNPATSNHYGSIQLYNHQISKQTSDEEILKLRADYLEWRKGILNILEENGYIPDNNEFNDLFSISGMFGTLYFLGVPVDIYGDIDKTYRQRILVYLTRKGIITKNNISED